MGAVPPGAQGSEGQGQVKWEEPCPSEELGGSSQAGASWRGSPWRPLLAPLPCGHLGWQAHWDGARDGHKGVLVCRAWELGGQYQTRLPSSRRHLQAAAPGTGAEGASHPRGPLAKAEPLSAGPGPRSVEPSRASRWLYPLGREEGHPVRSCLPGMARGPCSACLLAWPSVRLCSFWLRAGPAPSSCPPIGPGPA